jgi:hypothetical protein
MILLVGIILAIPEMNAGTERSSEGFSFLRGCRFFRSRSDLGYQHLTDLHLCGVGVEPINLWTEHVASEES